MYGEICHFCYDTVNSVIIKMHIRERESINLRKPANGLFLTHSYHNGRARAKRDFFKIFERSAFSTWLFSEPDFRGADSCAPATKEQLVEDNCKGSQFVRFQLSRDKTLFGFSLDINWTDDNSQWCGGGHKHYGAVPIQLFMSNPERHLYDGIVVSEKTQPGRPSRMIFDLDGSEENFAELDCETLPQSPEEFREYFCDLLITFFEDTLKLPLKRAEICCDPRSDMSKKWSYHVILQKWVACWVTEMPQVIYHLSAIDKRKRGWLQNNILDPSLYGRWKVLGCVHSTKWKYLRKYVARESDTYSRFLPDPQSDPSVNLHLVHSYSENQPETIKIPLAPRESFTVKKKGSSNAVSKIKLTRKQKHNVDAYNPGPVEFRSKATPGNLSARELLRCIYPANHHMIWDVEVTRAYTVLASAEGVNYGEALDFYLLHIENNAPNTEEGRRRCNRNRVKPQFRGHWNKSVVTCKNPDKVSFAFKTLLSYVNQTVESETLDDSIIHQAFDFPKKDAECFMARYCSQYITMERFREIKEQCVGLRSECDTGKSTLVVEIFKQMKAKRLLYIISSRSLANTAAQKLTEKGFRTANYLNYDNHEALRKNNVVVITMQSLFKIQGAADWDLVVIDEAVSCQADSMCPKTNQKQALNFQTLGSVLTRSRKTIFLDAHLTTNQVDFMKIFFPEIKLYYNHFRKGFLGTPKQHAFLYPQTNVHKLNEAIVKDGEDTWEHTLWYTRLDEYMKANIGNNKFLTQIYASPDSDYKAIRANYCETVKIAEVRQGLVKCLRCDDHIIDLLMSFADFYNKSLFKSVIIDGKVTASCHRRGIDPFEGLKV